MTAILTVQGLEKRFGGSFLGSEWLQRGAELAARVCVVRLNSAPRGTGFLVGPDLVLTCRHVIAPVLDEGRSLSDLRFVFDHARGPDGSPMSVDDFRAQWRARANVQNVSDTHYFEDFGSTSLASSTVFLPRDLRLTRRDEIWQLAAQVVNFQTLDDQLSEADRP